MQVSLRFDANFCFSSEFVHEDDQPIDLAEVQNTLLSKVVELSSVEAISSTAIRVTWQITIENSAYVEGFFIRFRDMSGGSQKFNMKTVMNSAGAASHIITGLRKYTEYEVFLMPFYKMMEGQPSNSLHIQTLEDVPSAPPTNLRAEMVRRRSRSISEIGCTQKFANFCQLILEIGGSHLILSIF